MCAYQNSYASCSSVTRQLHHYQLSNFITISSRTSSPSALDTSVTKRCGAVVASRAVARCDSCGHNQNGNGFTLAFVLHWHGLSEALDVLYYFVTHWYAYISNISGHLGARRDICAAQSPGGRRPSLILKPGMYFPRFTYAVFLH